MDTLKSLTVVNWGRITTPPTDVIVLSAVGRISETFSSTAGRRLPKQA